MPQLSIGQAAPDLRLPAAQGGEVALADYRGRAHVILLFAKGIACGFCRQKMSQLARGLERFRGLGAEVVMVAPTPPERGAFYAKNFKLPFTYLCDPGYRGYEAFGLVVRPHSVMERAVTMFYGMRTKPPESDIAAVKPTFGEIGKLINDDDLGFFIVDKAGIIRYSSVSPYIVMQGPRPVAPNKIPSNEEIVQELERLGEPGGSSPASAG